MATMSSTPLLARVHGPDPPKEFPVTTENNSLVTAVRRFVRGAQAPANHEHPDAELRALTRNSLKNSLKNSLMQGICARDGFAGDCFHRVREKARALRGLFPSVSTSKDK
jgi:hypothetical protein